MSEHFRRMIALADEFFSTKNDPEQLDVTPEVMEALQALHPSTLSEEVEGDGPVVWILLIPTSTATMERFLAGTITEKKLLEESAPGDTFQALYLCSALVLPEFRQQGRAFRTARTAIASILHDHPVTRFYTWNFSEQGAQLARRLSEEFNIPLSER